MTEQQSNSTTESDDLSKDNQERRNVDHTRLFPKEFYPGNWDVICQRGRENFEHSKKN